MTESIIASETQRTTCCYCGVGCGVVATISDNRVTAVKGDPDHPANLGRLCVKGSALHDTQSSPDRLLRPKVLGQDTDWDSALDYTAERFRAIIEEHGPDSVAFYLSGQLLTEDYYVANKLMKGFIGTSNVDTNSRLCMASAVVAHKRAFGGDLVPGCYEDLEQADVVFLVGSNTAYAHPVTYQRLVKAKSERPEMRVVVIDPRRTATCEIADQHLPIRPGTDAFFYNGLLVYMAQQECLNWDYIHAHCEGFEETLVSAQAQVKNTAEVALACEVPEQQLIQVYELFARNSKVVTVFSQGINQSSSGVDKGNAIINCHLATGKIGRPGAAPFSITGQPNAMGGREVGGLANQLAAHMGFANPEDVDRVQRFWQAPNMAQTEGLKAVDMFKAVHEGRIKAIWIMATNPAVTMPNADLVKEALRRCELVVVSDCIGNTDTAVHADVLLPATTWSEKNGTVTNSERCISLQKSLLPAPGEALNDWDIITRFAHKMGYGAAFDYHHPVDIFREHAALSAFENTNTRGFNIEQMQDISLDDYQNLRPIQWPVTRDKPQGSARMFEGGQYFTPSKKAQLIPVQARLPWFAPTEQQVIMNTGRIRDQWHTMSRTGNAAKLLSHVDEPYVDVHPQDIARFALTEGGLVVLQNLGARYYGRVKASAAQRPGEVFVPMHWNGKYAASSRADALVNDVVDPLCGQPEFKHSPVTIEPYTQAWNGFLVCVEDLQPAVDYWAKITLAQGYKYRLAHNRLPSSWAEWLREQFPNVEAWAELADSEGQFYRAAGYRDGRLQVIFSGALGTVQAKETRWLEGQLGESPDAQTRFALLSGNPGSGVEDDGAIICSCYQVGENKIKKAIAGGCCSVQALGEQLQCGTNCGSCIPELSALLQPEPALV